MALPLLIFLLWDDKIKTIRECSYNPVISIGREFLRATAMACYERRAYSILYSRALFVFYESIAYTMQEEKGNAHTHQERNHSKRKWQGA